MSFAGAGPGRDRRSVNETERGRSRAGLKILIPGYPQWSWRQRARGFVLFGSYLVALGVGLFSWGTPVGAVVLAFAYGSHVASATDVIRQEAFPGFGRWVPLFSTSGGLGLGLYGPALALASLVAWPGMGDGLAWDGYLVNCRAYRTAPPEHGDWVWLRSSPWGQGRLGRIVAGPGQEVEWSVEQLRVGGVHQSAGVSWLAPQIPADLALIVPSNHALVAPVSSGSAKTGQKTPVLVPCGEIVGRAWARYYPIRERRLLR